MLQNIIAFSLTAGFAQMIFSFVFLYVSFF